MTLNVKFNFCFWWMQMSSISTCPYEVFQAQILGLTTAKGSLLNPWHVAGGPRLPLAGNHVPGLLRVARSQPAALLTTAQLGGFHLLPTATAIWVLEQKYALKTPVSHPDCVLHSLWLILHWRTCPECESTSHRSQRAFSLKTTSWCHMCSAC